jgi:hypothetical protein
MTWSSAQVRRGWRGGHWLDGYPFLRLHQPSACYGVNSRVLGNNRIDESGPSAGFYERAPAAEVCDYYARVLDEQLPPSGQVRFFGMCDYRGAESDGHRFVSTLTGATTTVKVRRKLVDATYMEVVGAIEAHSSLRGGPGRPDWSRPPTWSTSASRPRATPMGFYAHPAEFAQALRPILESMSKEG